MANFTLNIATESSAELLEIVSKIAASMPLPTGKSALAHGGAVHAEVNKQVQVRQQAEDSNQLPTAEQLDQAEQAGALVPAPIPERDGHGIKRDDRIHANAADPFKADGTWKRRKNVPDEQYEEIHLELVREARAAGLYTGPAIPELELEDRVVDAEPQTGGHIPAGDLQVVHEATAPTTYQIGEGKPLPDGVAALPNPNAGLPVAPPAPAPTPTPVAPPAPTGMSAEATPTYQQAVMKLVQQAGPKAPVAMMRIMGVKSAAELTPEQLRSVVQAADMVTLAPTDKPTKGAQAVTEAFIALGVEVNVEQLADLGVSV